MPRSYVRGLECLRCGRSLTEATPDGSALIAVCPGCTSHWRVTTEIREVIDLERWRREEAAAAAFDERLA